MSEGLNSQIVKLLRDSGETYVQCSQIFTPAVTIMGDSHLDNVVFFLYDNG